MADKQQLHERNQHQGRYDLPKLIETNPDLKPFVAKNKFGDLSVDFFNPQAVKELNKALLMEHYNVEFWDIPNKYLVPPIPGRADYIHYVADLLKPANGGKIPYGNKFTCLDIGTGANLIYPIVGVNEYNWTFQASEIDRTAFNNANKIVNRNKILKGQVEVKLQEVPKDIFYRVFDREHPVDVTICNPPFHSSAKEAREIASQKVRNLKGKSGKKPQLNFGGQSNELWCEGGEKRFIRNMIRQSKKFEKHCFWFTTLVSKGAHLNTFKNALEKENPTEVKVIEMGQGNKVSRILAWTFLNKAERVEWAKRWK